MSVQMERNNDHTYPHLSAVSVRVTRL